MVAFWVNLVRSFVVILVSMAEWHTSYYALYIVHDAVIMLIMHYI